MRCFLWMVPVCLQLAAAGLGALEEEAGDQVRGVTISTHGIGYDWGTDAIVPALEQIKALGANWVAIHPYARISGDGTVSFRDFDPDKPPAHLVRPIAEAHRLGLRICIKPHLAYWGSPFAWRGEITFDQDEEWTRFWQTYRYWIVKVAAACRRADGFVVGTELDLTLDREEEWRAIIAQVRQQTAAPLSYAANWTDYQRVPFWDALDSIGIQAYFPIAAKAAPSRAELDQGWGQRMDELRQFAKIHNRRILFTELGYNRSYRAAIEPWSYEVDDMGASAVQHACLASALEAIEAEPLVVGALLWKWFPPPRPVGRNFQLATPPIKKLITQLWSADELYLQKP